VSNHSPIPSPPWELVKQWSDIKPMEDAVVQNWVKIATKAARWGADQELEACCDHMRDHQWGFVERPDGTKIHRAIYLQQSRRPKPPSLRKQAYDALDTYIYGEPDPKDKERTYSTIRRALEALDD
jgi:hypothetical protein